MYNQEDEFKKCINDNYNLAPKDINYLFYLKFIKNQVNSVFSFYYAVCKLKSNWKALISD